MGEKIPTWGIVTFMLSIIVTFSSLLYANNSRVSEREWDSHKLILKEQQVKTESMDKRVTIVETKLDTILEGIRDLNTKIESQGRRAYK